jgi:hypothetical protein
MDVYLGDEHPCYLVSASPESHPGWTLVAKPRYDKYVVAGTAHVYVYRTTGTVCH